MYLCDVALAHFVHNSAFYTQYLMEIATINCGRGMDWAARENS